MPDCQPDHMAALRYYVAFIHLCALEPTSTTPVLITIV